MTCARRPGVPQVGDLVERVRRMAASSRSLAGHPHHEHAPARGPRGSTSSTSKATTVLADAVWRSVPSPVRKTIWPSSSR